MEIFNICKSIGVATSPAPTKQNGVTTDESDEKDLIRRLKKLYSFTALADSPQMQDMLTSQIIMQKEILERMYTNVKSHIDPKTSVVIPETVNGMPIEVTISEPELEVRLEKLNAQLDTPINIDEATIISYLNNFRDAREKILEAHFDNLAALLKHLQNQSKSDKLPMKKKSHVFSATGKEAGKKAKTIEKEAPAIPSKKSNKQDKDL